MNTRDERDKDKDGLLDNDELRSREIKRTLTETKISERDKKNVPESKRELRSVGDLMDSQDVPTQLAGPPYNVPDNFYEVLDKLIEITSSDSQQRAKVVVAVRRMLNPTRD